MEAWKTCLSAVWRQSCPQLSFWFCCTVTSICGGYATSEQLVCERGILLRKVDYMELYRIVDFQEKQSILQQLCGLKTVSILSMDRNTPRLDLLGMRRSDGIVALIRERVEYNKRKKGIYEITNH